MARDQAKHIPKSRNPATYTVRFARDRDDVQACQQLRHRCFFGGDGIDADIFDATSQHLMVLDQTDQIVSTVRLRVTPARLIGDGYTGQFYDLTALSTFPAPVMEIGRMCVDSTTYDPHIMRAAWGALTVIVDHHQVGLIFGCSSFAGTKPDPHVTSFQRLHDRYRAPDHFGRVRKSAHVVPFATLSATDTPQAVMPPLMRTYLAMGGWVSGHAVVDHQMNTLHVLTGIETANIPKQRAQILRGLGASSTLVLDPCQTATLVG